MYFLLLWSYYPVPNMPHIYTPMNLVVVLLHLMWILLGTNSGHCEYSQHCCWKILRCWSILLCAAIPCLQIWSRPSCSESLPHLVPDEVSHDADGTCVCLEHCALFQRYIRNPVRPVGCWHLEMSSRMRGHRFRSLCWQHIFSLAILAHRTRCAETVRDGHECWLGWRNVYGCITNCGLQSICAIARTASIPSLW